MTDLLQVWNTSHCLHTLLIFLFPLHVFFLPVEIKNVGTS